MPWSAVIGLSRQVAAGKLSADMAQLALHSLETDEPGERMTHLSEADIDELIAELKAETVDLKWLAEP